MARTRSSAAWTERGNPGDLPRTAGHLSPDTVQRCAAPVRSGPSPARTAVGRGPLPVCRSAVLARGSDDGRGAVGVTTHRGAEVGVDEGLRDGGGGGERESAGDVRSAGGAGVATHAAIATREDELGDLLLGVILVEVLVAAGERGTAEHGGPDNRERRRDERGLPSE